jgi:hypothetical protein
MAKDPFTAALAGFRRWAKATRQKLSGDPVADADELKTLLDLMRDYLGIERPAELGPGDLEELLLRVYPRKITVFDRVDTEDTIPAVRDFLTYLAESGGLTEGARRELERELDRIAPRFTDAVMDPANWGMARSFVQLMAADGVDMSDQAAMDRWLAAYNAREALAGGMSGPGDDYEDYEDEEDVSFKDAFGLPDRLPPMRLPSEPELAAMARDAPMIGQLRALAAWLGPGRTVTENAELDGGAAAEAAAALGIGVPSATDDQALPGLMELPAAGRMRDVPRLEYLWQLALDGGFVELDEDESHAVPGEVAEAFQHAGDDEVLDIWKMVFALVVGTALDIAASLDPRRSRELDFFGQGAGLAVMLFLARPDGLPVAEASEMIRSAAVDELAPAQAAKAWQSWVRAHGDPAGLLLDLMTELGAVRVSDSDDGSLARLTPLGLAALRTQLLESGVEVPLLPPAEQMTAADLIAMADGTSEEEFQAETEAWLAHRTPESAARDLLSAAAEADPGSRMLAVAVVTELGAPAESAWRDALGRLELRGYAKVTLAALTGGDPAADMPAGLDLTPDDLAWILTDGLAVEGWNELDDDAEHDPAALAKRLREAIPAGEEPAVFELMARVPHPDAASVLTVVGRYHPDKKVAKAARKAAYKAASRQAARGSAIVLDFS